MWDMTPFGILMPALRPAHTIEEGDDRLLQIRTRRAKELDILREKYLPALGETIATPNMDYNFRAYCTHEQYAEAMRLMILDIDYTKFKPTTEDKFKDHELHGVYNAIWGTVCRLGSPGGKWADSSWTNYRSTGTRATTTANMPRPATAWRRPEPTLSERFAATEAEVWEEPETAASRRRGRSRWVPNRGARKARRQHLDFEEGRASGYDEGYNDGWEDGYDYRDREARHTVPATETDDVRDGDALWRDINEAVLADLAAANIDTAHLDAIRDEAESFEAERNAEIARRRGALFFSGDSRIGGPL